MLHVIDRKLLPNCPIARADIKMAEYIFGPSMAHLKEKRVRRSTDHIVEDVKALPTHIMEKYVKVSFKMNSYDWCCMNKMVNGKQLTILWHVDNLKISHKNLTIVTELLDEINKEYGKILPLTVTRGKKHEYLGMTIDFSVPGNMKLYPCTDPKLRQGVEVFILEWRYSNYIPMTKQMYYESLDPDKPIHLLARICFI